MSQIPKDSTAPNAASDLVEKIDQVVHWLPNREPLRPRLMTGVAAIDRNLTDATQALVDVLRLRAQARELTPSRFRTLLMRRLDELCRMFGLLSHGKSPRASQL